MRDLYHEELDALTHTLVALAASVGVAIGRATSALLTGDLSAAEKVISGDNDIDASRDDIEARILTVMARQQPVATDLRRLVVALRVTAALERMGDLANHVAVITRWRFPDRAVPTAVEPMIERMGEIAQGMTARIGAVLATGDPQGAAELRQADDEMDSLHRGMFGHLCDDGWPHGMAAAVDLTLISRYYERFADHAVSIAHQVVFISTGSRIIA